MQQSTQEKADHLADCPSERVKSARILVFLMGFIAMLGDMTYEGVRGLGGPFLRSLGASAFAIGFVAGFGEFLGYGLRYVSGWLSDRSKAYWPLIGLGYGMNALVVLGLAFSTSWQMAMCFFFLERIGKAIRSPARSTLVSFAANEAGPGKAFALDEMLDQIGAVSGPLLTALVMWGLQGRSVDARYKAAFLVLLLPVFANLLLLRRARNAYPKPESLEQKAKHSHLQWKSSFAFYLLATSLVAIAFADWALLSFHVAQTTSWSLAYLPLLYAGAMAVDALSAFIFGHLFDRIGVRSLAISTLIAAAFAPCVFWSNSSAIMLLGLGLWALGLGAQESIFKAAIAQMIPKEQRGRAYGTFYSMYGLSWWAGSATLGGLYTNSRTAMVLVSLVCMLIASVLFLEVHRRLVAPRS